MIIVKLGKPGEGMSFLEFLGFAPRTPCAPPPENDAVAVMATPVVFGEGVRTDRNANEWHQVAEFLTEQHLATLGLRRP